MAFKDLMIGAVIIGMFALSMMVFGHQSQVNYNLNKTILDDPALSGLNTTLTENLGTVRNNSESQRGVFYDTEAQGTEENFAFSGIISIVRALWGTATGTINAVTLTLSNILGIPKLFMNLIVAIIVIVALLLMWKVWKTGT